MIHSQFYQSRFNSIDCGCWGFYSHSPTFPKVLTLSYLHVSYSFRFGATFLITCSLHFLRIMTSHVISWLIICHSSFLFFFSCIFQFSKPSSLLQSPFKFTNFRPQSAFFKYFEQFAITNTSAVQKIGYNNNGTFQKVIPLHIR